MWTECSINKGRRPELLAADSPLPSPALLILELRDWKAVSGVTREWCDDDEGQASGGLNRAAAGDRREYWFTQ